MKLLATLLVSLGLGAALLLPVPSLRAAEYRTWTNPAGKTLEAEFLGLENGRVRLRRKDTGKVFTYTFLKLSAEDQAYVTAQVKKEPDSEKESGSNENKEKKSPQPDAAANQTGVIVPVGSALSKEDKEALAKNDAAAPKEDAAAATKGEDAATPKEKEADDTKDGETKDGKTKDGETKDGDTKPSTDEDPAAPDDESKPKKPPRKTKPAGKGKEEKKPKSPDVKKDHFELTETAMPIATLTLVAQRYGQFVTLRIPPNSKVVPPPDGKEPTWQVYVPLSYKPEEPHGALVFLNDTPEGQKAHLWGPTLDKHKMIMISPVNAGNGGDETYRMALAYRGLELIEQEYALDPKRMYVAGFGGGGRAASRMAVIFSDIFAGGFFQGGAEFWPPYWRAPTNKLIAQAREGRYVLLIGANDPVLQGVRMTYNQFIHSGFKSTTYMEVPGLAHALPDSDWFEKGILALDGQQPKKRK